MIKRIRIRNFKSLRDVDLELRKINVIVGPNGSGKSNLVDFFIFLKEFINPSSFPFDPFQTFGGYKETVFLHDTSLPISFEIAGDEFQYSTDITGKHRIAINRETLAYKDFLLDRTFDNVEIKKVKGTETIANKYQLSSEASSIFPLIKSLPIPVSSNEFDELFHFMRNFANSFIPLRINPERAFAPVHYSYPPKLEVDGYGLARVFDDIVSHKGLPEPISMFLEENNLSLDRYTSQEGNIVLVARETIPDLNKTLLLRPENVPAGIIKMITILFAIYALEPSLVIIDEIENSLHLKFIEELVSILSYSSPQFIITTHSPMVIDMFDPEDIILFYKEKGETKAERIKNPEKLKEKLLEDELTLSEWIFYSIDPTNP